MVVSINFFDQQYRQEGNMLVSRWVASADRNGARGGASTEALSFVFGAKNSRQWIRTQPVWFALNELFDYAQEKVVTPRVFMLVLYAWNERVRLFLNDNPIKSERFSDVRTIERISEFLSGRTVGWRRIEDFGRQLLTEKGHGLDYLISLAQFMQIGREVNYETGRGRRKPVPKFCALCWRFSMTSSQFCCLHSPVTSGGRGELIGGKNDDYRYANRLVIAFEASRKKLAAEARKLMLRSEWKDAVVAGNVRLWVRSRRPLVFEFIEFGLEECHGSDDWSLEFLVHKLDRVEGESMQERSARMIFHRTLLLRDRRAIFDMLLRAEAWLVANADRRSKWGGRRLGAGRPLVARGDVLVG